jgi:hypothetical protein
MFILYEPKKSSLLSIAQSPGRSYAPTQRTEYRQACSPYFERS